MGSLQSQKSEAKRGQQICSRIRRDDGGRRKRVKVGNTFPVFSIRVGVNYGAYLIHSDEPHSQKEHC